MARLVDRTAYPYRLPPVGADLRVTFVGRAGSAVGALHQRAGGLLPTVVTVDEDAPTEDLAAALRDNAPHVVVVLDPDLVPATALEALEVATLGLHAPRTGARADDLPRGFDRLAVTDGGHADREPDAVWRCLVPPVDDRRYGAARTPRLVKCVALGAETRHRGDLLREAASRFVVARVAVDGLGPAGEDAEDAALAIVAHDEPGSAFEHTILQHLAAGRLVLSEPIDPPHGLEPEIDFVVIHGAREIVTVLDQLERRPTTYERITLRGRAKAEAYRASRVWPRVIADLLADIAVFGGVRGPRPRAVRGG